MTLNMDSTPDFAGLRLEFPTLRRWAYLDIARKAPTPLCVEAAARDFFNDIYERAGQKSFSMEAVEDTRAALAGLLEVPSRTLAFVKNTSEGLNLAVQAIELEPGDNIVTSEFEHEAQMFPLQLAVETRGIQLRIARARVGRIAVQDVIDMMDERTRACAISYVAFGNGFRFDLPALAVECRARGIILISDAIQAIGVLATPLSEIGADIVVAGAHKALLGLNGTAFLYCRDGIVEQLRPSLVGKHSITSDRLAPAPLEYRGDARRFEYGNPNFLGIAALGRTVEFIRSIGLEHIEQQIRELTDYLIAKAYSRDLAIRTPTDWSERAGIVSFDLRRDSHEVSERLADKHVVANVKDGFVRASVHFYNSHEDLDRFIEVVAR
ncbi:MULTISPECIES: aminotransferase class V-fold PLP-dependent enzyme [unclassified Aurantimonas]|uniref:aminotransferase class V-fold PLP-dependent enzyme n=1 Tax=unclassified Aurantimonas TaxID=2638230 RepID=UPI002E17ED5A|nr:MULTISPECIES: aminotransferase class V-fold PLP-dependent enzyme [unclassified Aurantimonas]MEC5292793.1 aminotransferase class V-fold PLP-dependent enzyme [Aurantimonas sp. C2-3-R2]MEC5413845.1 aminotransferase class V-fold PLP-dependent enzyme [Aurantimonas sp. C2-4-R8]